MPVWNRWLLRPDILISVYRSTPYCDFANTQMRGDQRSSWSDFNTSAQRHLPDGRFGDRVLELFKVVQWLMPHVLLNEINNLAMLRALESDDLCMVFRSWDRVSTLTTKHSWAIKTATQLEKHYHIFFANKSKIRHVHDIVEAVYILGTTAN